MSEEAPRPDALRPRGRGALRIALLVALIAAAAFALFAQPRIIGAVRLGQLPPEWLLVAPCVFALFVVITAIDAVVLARRRGFMSGRMLLQLGFALAFVAMLTPQAFLEYRARKAPAPTSEHLLEQLAQSRDARVRALVMEVAGCRGPASGMAGLLLRGLFDADPLVREAAVAAVGHAEGTTLSGERRFDEARALVEAWLQKEAQGAQQP